MANIKLISLMAVFFCLTNFSIAQTTFTIEDLGKVYNPPKEKLLTGLYCHIASEKVNYGNTSIRNEKEKSLAWKGSPSGNGYGYFQRNRDLGQVFNVPDGKDVKLDALVFRSSLGSNAIMEGVSGSELYIVFYEVKTKEGESLRINENGTFKGDSATHGFDHQLNRCDDFIEGVEYVPIRKLTGGVFPEVPFTTQPAHPNDKNLPYGEQEGHLRYFRCHFQKDSDLVLEGGKRYAFIIGFKEPGINRGLALAIKTEVHTKENAEFEKDENGFVRWGIRREGNGKLPPTMIQSVSPPSDKAAYNTLVAESMFPENHYETLSPTSNGYPDVDTYRTLQFYLEISKIRLRDN